MNLLCKKLEFYGIHLKGLKGVKNVECRITVNDKTVNIYSENMLLKSLEKKYVKYIGIDQEIEEDTSVIGRAIIGGILFNRIGALIGAMSALNRNTYTVSLIQTDNDLIVFASL